MGGNRLEHCGDLFFDSFVVWGSSFLDNEEP